MQLDGRLGNVESAADLPVGESVGDHLKDFDLARREPGLADLARQRRKRARYVNDNISEYLVPVNADIGEVEIILIPEEDRELNPAGVKGLGELANVGTAAAVTSAVHHATGIRIRDLPIRIEKLLAYAARR